MQEDSARGHPQCRVWECKRRELLWMISNQVQLRSAQERIGMENMDMRMKRKRSGGEQEEMASG